MPDAFVGATAGAIGAVIALASTYPLKVVKQRLQADSHASHCQLDNFKKLGQLRTQPQPKEKTLDIQYNGVIDCIRKTLANEGFSGLFAGVTLALPQTAVWNFIFYLFLELLRPIWIRRPRSHMLSNILHGISAGVCTQLVMLPADAVNLRCTVMFQPKTSSSSSNVYLHLAREIYAEGGIAGFYAGILPGLLLTINPGIVQCLRKWATDQITAIQLLKCSDHQHVLSDSQNFWIGLVAKLIASMITYPLVIAKVLFTTQKNLGFSANAKMEKKMEKKSGSNRGAPSQDCQFSAESSRVRSKTDLLKLLVAWQDIVKQNGIGGLYKGCRPHLAQAAIKAGITNVIRLRLLMVVGWVLQRSGT